MNPKSVTKLTVLTLSGRQPGESEELPEEELGEFSGVLSFQVSSPPLPS